METVKTFTTPEEATEYNASLPVEKQGSVQAFQIDEDQETWVIAQISVLCEDGVYRQDIMMAETPTAEDIEKAEQMTEEDIAIQERVDNHIANRDPDNPPTPEELLKKAYEGR